MKKILFITIIILLLTGCANNNSSTPGEEKSVDKTTLNFNLNKKDKKYLLFLIPPGVRKTEYINDDGRGHLEGTGTGYAGPYEIKGDLSIDFDENYEIRSLLENSKSNELEVYITTLEDTYIRNPLNKPTKITFDVEDLGVANLKTYTPNETNFNIDINDKYPDGVISLPFPEAVFIIKLNFKKGNVNKDDFVVTYKIDNPDLPNAFGTYGFGNVARAYFYYEAPFYESDDIASTTGKIYIENIKTKEEVKYEGYPMSITFDKNKKVNEKNKIIINIEDY